MEKEKILGFVSLKLWLDTTTKTRGKNGWFGGQRFGFLPKPLLINNVDIPLKS